MCCGENKDGHRKLPSKDVGLMAPRGCTNICFIFLFIACWALMFVILGTAVKLGDLGRLLYGVDYMGNVCSKGSPNIIFTNSGSQGPSVPWAARTKLWYPVTFDANRGTFLFTEAVKLGVCVENCPTTSISSLSFLDVYRSPNASSPSLPYVVLFNSSVQFNRCIPDISSFNCSYITSSSGQVLCRQLFRVQQFSRSTAFNLMEDAYEQLANAWWVILTCSGISIVVCFIWMFVLRRMVKPLVIVTLILILVAVALTGYFLFYKYAQMKDDAPNDADNKYYLGGAIAVWVVGFLLLCVILFMFRDIMIACDIIEEASKIPLSMPTMLLVPVVAVVFILPVAVLCMFIAAYVYTAASSVPITLIAPVFDGANSTSFVQGRTYNVEYWRVYAGIYNLLMFLWSLGFIQAVTFMMLSFCAVFWYWSNPGDDKKPEAGVLKALQLTFRYHLGTVAVGSLIIAIIQLLRILMKLLEKRMEAFKDNKTVKCLLLCAQCWLACLERFVKFVNHNAYVMCSMTGEGFMDGARHALSLLVHNALSVGAVTVVGEYVMIMGKILITVGVSAIGFVIQSKANGSPSSNGFLAVVVIAVVTYCVTCVFINVFGVCIDVVLLSYCYDLQANDGQSKPYYFPSDLGKHVDRAKERMTKNQKEADTAVPLKQQL